MIHKNPCKKVLKEHGPINNSLGIRGVPLGFYVFFPQNHRSSPSRYPLCQGHCGPAPVGSILHTCLVIEGCKSLHNLNLKDGQFFMLNKMSLLLIG